MKFIGLNLIALVTLLLLTATNSYAYRDRVRADDYYGAAIRTAVQNVSGGVQVTYTSDNAEIAHELQVRATRDAERYNAGAYCPMDEEGHLRDDSPGYGSQGHWHD